MGSSPKQQLIGHPPLRVCYLVSNFPQLSEAFMAYEFAEVAKQVSVWMVSLHKPQTPCEHPILQNRAFDRVRYLKEQRRNLRGLGILSQILLTQGLCSDSVIAAKHLGYRTMIQCARQVSQCLAVMQEIKPDVIHAHFAGMSRLANAISREMDIPYVVAVHGSDIRYRRSELTDRALREADAVACGSRDDQDIVVNDFGVELDRAQIIHYAVDAELFQPMEAVRNRHLLAVGRLHKVKGYDVLIEAAALLQQVGVEFTLDILGDGPEKESLTRQITELNLQDHVRLLEPRSHAELPRIYARASLVVMPSRSEGFGCVSLEAMACGLPLVAARVGGLCEAVEKDTGYYFEPENPQSLAEVLARALSEPDRLQQMGRRAREVVLEKYQYSRCAEQLVDLWRRCVSDYCKRGEVSERV